MHGQCVASSTVSIPDCGLVDFYESKGNAPAARWGHTAVVVNEKLYVFGGEGDQAYGDLHIFEPGIRLHREQSSLTPAGLTRALLSLQPSLPLSGTGV